MAWLQIGQFILPILLMLTGLVFGRILERRHYASIRLREKALAEVLVFGTRFPPEASSGQRSFLVSGSVVISSDYFKSFVAGLRNLIGGHFRGYETLLERARREAVLRLKQDARQQGASLVVGLRFQTTHISGRATPCVEVLAFGTALRPTSTAD